MIAGVFFEAQAEHRRDRFAREVVVGRSQAAVSTTRSTRAQGLTKPRFKRRAVVADHGLQPQLDAELVEPRRSDRASWYRAGEA